MRNKEELIKIDVALDYAVDWDNKRIYRDLVQNFYDSTDSEHFFEAFRLREIKKQNTYDIVMEMKGTSFSYEWLTYIGGSTKTDSPGSYVGMYGEGFKISSLCLYRNKKEITMESADWSLEVCKYKKKIDGKIVPMLGYIKKSRNDDGITRLLIRNVNEKELYAVDEAVMNFYYPENPLLGKRIAKGEKYAIHKRSNIRIPCDDWCCIKGILFCNNLARGRLPIDLVINIKTDMRKDSDRSRKAWDDYQSIAFLNKHIDMLDAKASYQLLNHMNKYWNDLPQRLVDLESWYYVICQLVRNVSKDPYIRRKFLKKNTDLVYLARPSADRFENKKLREIKEWARDNPIYANRRFVNPIFRLLGAHSVAEDYERENITNLLEIGEDEKKLCEILYSCMENVWPYKIYDTRPPVFLFKGIHVDQMQFCERDYGSNREGKRYRIKQLIISRENLKTESFDVAFMEFANNLFHVYGTDTSAKINAILTYFGGELVGKASVLELHRKKWNEVFLTEVKEDAGD